MELSELGGDFSLASQLETTDEDDGISGKEEYTRMLQEFLSDDLEVAFDLKGPYARLNK